jgi:hypothetical protein
VLLVMGNPVPVITFVEIPLHLLSTNFQIQFFKMQQSKRIDNYHSTHWPAGLCLTLKEKEKEMEKKKLVIDDHRIEIIMAQRERKKREKKWSVSIWLEGISARS